MTAVPSRVQVIPRIRGPGGSSISCRYGRVASGSTIQIEVGDPVSALMMARRRPWGAHASVPLAKPGPMGGGGSVVYNERPVLSMNPTLACRFVPAGGARYAITSRVGDLAGWTAATAPGV